MDSSGINLIEEMMSHLRADFIDYDPASEVAQFFANRSIFITGATGFLGKVMVEKLLRSCRDVKMIYLLVREKRGKNVNERLTDLTQSQIFERIRSRPSGAKMLKEKLQVITGDITMPKFGISQQDMSTLCREVSIVINSAATIRFNEPLDVAAKNNTYSVGQLIEFCDELPKLEALVHLSTAYSNCHKLDTIYEMFYEPPLGGRAFLDGVREMKEFPSHFHAYPERDSPDKSGELSRDACLLQRFPPDERDQLFGEPLEVFANNALRKCSRPNSYTFTKAISERFLLDLVRARPDRYLNDKIQVAIVRPSIVCAAWREPNVGFVDNFNGPSGIIIGLYTGVLQAVPGDKEKVVDVVPVDMVANMTLSVVWHMIANKVPRGNSPQVKLDHGVYIYNFVSGCRNPIQWGLLPVWIAKLAYKYPSDFLARLPSSFFIRAGIWYDIYDYINHKCPAAFLDFFEEKIMRKKLTPRTSSLTSYKRISSQLKTLAGPFSIAEWNFNDSNVVALYKSLPEIDKEMFNFDVATIDWDRYSVNYIFGTRIYALKEDLANMPRAMKSLKVRQLLYKSSMLLLPTVLYYFFSDQLQLEKTLLGAFD